MGLFNRGNIYVNQTPRWMQDRYAKTELGDFTIVFEVADAKIPLLYKECTDDLDALDRFQKWIDEAVAEGKEHDIIPWLTIEYASNGETLHPFTFRADWVAGFHVYKGRKGMSV